MLDAVYVDAKDEKRIVAIKPKPPFWPVFQVATTKEESGVLLMQNGPPESSPEARRCFWWRRGRVERYLKHRGAIWMAAVVPVAAWRALPAPAKDEDLVEGVPLLGGLRRVRPRSRFGRRLLPRAAE